jgi:amino acid adenylation domain-containing protein
MQRLLGHYRCILEAIVVDPELPIARIPLLSRSESASLLAAAAGGAPVAPAEAVTTAFVEQARRRPQAPALFDDQGSLSYAQLERCSRRLAARLRAAGAGPGERVAVCLERDRRMAVALLATLRSGAAYVPLDPLFPTERIGYTLQDSAPRVLLTERRLRASLPVDGTVTCLYLDDIDALADEDDDTGRHAVADIPPDPVQAAYVIYTSGSTGRPKGVEVPAGALANFLASMRHSPGIGAGDRVLAVTTVAFDIAGLELWLPLTSGATLRLLPANQAADASALLAVMQQWRPTLMQATPATWKMLLDAGWPGDPQLTVLCGGEALAPELARALCRRSAAVWNMYGPTETTIWSALYRVRGDEAGRVPVGRPIDATRLYVLDRHGELQPQGIAGELYIGGAGVASGYFGRPELTAQRFLPDPFAANAANSANAVGDAPPRMYRTGDCVRLRGDGNFEYLSRLDDQIKLRGFRIEPGEIEALLREHPAIRDAVVVVRPRHGDAGAAAGEDDQRLVAYYVPAVGAAPIPRSELAEPLQRRLPAYMVPSAFVALPALPLTANGKIDRRALPAPVFEDAADDAGYLAPRDALEAELATLWAEVLALPRIGVRDDFFRRGGYSLLAMRLFARIEQQFGAALPLAALLERPTVEYLAERIRELRSRPAAVPALHDVDSRSFSHLVPIQTRGRRAPLFCVHGAGGNVLNFSRLAHYLGLARPLYGLQARGVDGRTAPFLSIEDMAAAYLQELRALQPQGPYYLGGYCGGGVIAFEMARRLRGEGETVALLALLDCYRPSLTFGVSRPRRWTYGIVHGGARYVRDKLVDRVRRDLRELSSWLRIGWARLRGQTVPFGLRDFWLTQHFLKSAQRYTPQPYPGKLTILRATEVDPELLGAGPELGWTGLASGGIQVFDVPGNHHSLMQEPNIGVLAATLGRCIEAAECGAAG